MSVVEFRMIREDPLRAVVVGAGEMGRVWLQTVLGSSDVALAGLVDVDVEAAERAVGELAEPVAYGSDLADVAKAGEANVVIDVTTPAAHLAVTLQSFALGLPVLGEKPVAATVSEGLILAAASGLSGELFMVSQSRRYNEHLHRFKAELDRLGNVGVLTTQFYRAPRFGGFRDRMQHPLLLDMAIHPFDSARWLLAADPVSVLCEEYNPQWSWYAGAAATTAIFDMDAGRRYIFTGSWCSPGLETSWNGEWRASAAGGSVMWDGEIRCDVDAHPQLERTMVTPTVLSGEGTAGALADFVMALRTGETPMGEVRDNVMSLAMVSAAVEAAGSGGRVFIDDVLERALAEAVDEAPAPVSQVLQSWRSVRESLGVSVVGGRP